MPAYKVFSHDDKPKVSVIIPSLDGFRDGNVEKLISDIKSQSFKSVEIILSVNLQLYVIAELQQFLWLSEQ